MKPVVVSITVPQGREEVFDLLDDLGAHEEFTDHLLHDWEVSGPPTGVGATARMKVRKPGADEPLEMRVVVTERPLMTAEESVSAGGRRRTRGTYRLEALPGGATRVSFELAWLDAPLSERLAAPLVRAVMRRGNARSLERLAGVLAERAERPKP